jgi:hypothetical protein
MPRPSGANLGWDNASATWRPLAVVGDGKLDVNSETNISSITVEAFPVYADEAGDVATATVNADNQAEVELASETIGLMDAIEQPTDFQQQTINLAAGVAQDITTEITGDRKYIIIKTQDTTAAPFWFSIDGAAVVGTNGTLVQDWVKLDVPTSVTVSLICSETVDISVVEAGN